MKLTALSTTLNLVKFVSQFVSFLLMAHLLTPFLRHISDDLNIGRFM